MTEMATVLSGPIAFVEPDLSSLTATRPMSPDPGDKRDSLSDKQKQGLLVSLLLLCC